VIMPMRNLPMRRAPFDLVALIRLSAAERCPAHMEMVWTESDCSRDQSTCTTAWFGRWISKSAALAVNSVVCGCYHGWLMRRDGLD
jgi:hypothetical protein